MSIDNWRSYRESDILEAEGCRLIVLLYSAALDSVAAARRHLAEGNIEARSREITRTSEILNELALAVDHDAGGELSRNLVELYDYLQTLLQRANAEQIDPPLAETENLLETLSEAWASSTAPAADSTPFSAVAVLDGDAGRTPVDCMG